MQQRVDRSEDTLKWPQVRRWLLAILGVSALLLAAYFVKGALLLRKLRAHGGSIEALESWSLVDKLMYQDGCYIGPRPRPSWAAFVIHDYFALSSRCALWFRRHPGDEGLAAVHEFKCATDIYLGETPLSDDDLRFLRGLSNLDDLNLYGTDIKGPGLAHLRDLPRLRRLVLANTALDDEGLRHLDDLPALEALALNDTRVTGAGLGRLTRFRNLRDLDLRNTPIDDEALRSLAGLALTRLDLGDTAITDAGLAHLERFPKLRWLNLANTAVTDAGLESLQRLPRLSEVDLTGTRVTREVAMAKLGKVEVFGP